MGEKNYTIKQELAQEHQFKSVVQFLWFNKTRDFNIAQKLFVKTLISLFVVSLSSFIYLMIDKGF